MPAKEKHPGKPAPWPPKGSWAVHQVGLSATDNWWKLGRTHGRPNPWDIIIFNFQTEDPKEVNWYLREYVGCKNTKGNNYIFKGASPGDVHMPPPTWMPARKFRKGSSRTDYPEKIKKTVASMIRRNASYFPTVKLAGSTVDKSNLLSVAKAIEDGKIVCHVRPGIGLSGAVAAYEPGSDIMLFSKEPNAGTMDDVASVMHEATHASFDKRNVGKVPVSTMELIAHAVQYCVMARRFRSIVKRRLEKGFLVDPDYFLLRFGWVVMADKKMRRILDLDAVNAMPNLEDPFEEYADFNPYHDLYTAVRNRYKTRLGPGFKIIKGNWGDKMDCNGLN